MVALQSIVSFHVWVLFVAGVEASFIGKKEEGKKRAGPLNGFVINFNRNVIVVD